jgi:hypothetical protein
MCAAESENTWPNAAVALMPAAHATELFLEGAIVSRKPGAAAKVHRLVDLATTYHTTFPEVEFAFDIPFQGDYTGLTEEEAIEITKCEPTPGVFFRYPVSSHGVEWRGLQAFEPCEFLRLISNLDDAFRDIAKRIQQLTPANAHMQSDTNNTSIGNP